MRGRSFERTCRQGARTGAPGRCKRGCQPSAKERRTQQPASPCVICSVYCHDTYKLILRENRRFHAVLPHRRSTQESIVPVCVSMVLYTSSHGAAVWRHSGSCYATCPPKACQGRPWFWCKARPGIMEGSGSGRKNKIAYFYDSEHGPVASCLEDAPGHALTLLLYHLEL